jgi:DMSO reductase anchor subunit
MELANWHKLEIFLLLFTTLSMCCIGMFGMFYAESKEKEKDKTYIILAVILTISGALGMVFIPSVSWDRDENGHVYYYKKGEVKCDI